MNIAKNFGLKHINKRSSDTVLRGNPKTREEMWHQHFINESNSYDQSKSLIQLLYNVTVTYLNDCTPVILYDDQINSTEGYLFQNLMKNFPVDFVHGVIDDKKRLIEPNILRPKDECLHYILFINDVKSSASVLGKQSNNKIVVITKSSQWAVQEFLSSSMSRIFADLLVIDQSFKEDDDSLEAPYILYTHQLYSDGLGTSKPFILTSWKKGKFSRNVNLFPRKISEGYAGHRFLIAAANQPPFVFKKHVADADGGNPRIVWDGIEIRILKVLSELNNFTIEIVEPRDLHLGPSDAVANEIALERSDIGVAGLYLTTEIIRDMEYSFAHSQDCAAFVTLASTALPRYRAILGPFHWHVWVALTFTYLIAIFPLAFSDKHTLSHLINNTGEVENMFWYVFGTFTNCFTFVGKNSWSKTDKITTRLLIDRGGWERWFLNSSDQNTNKLMKKLEFVRDIETGIRNVTKAFFWPYAFLGSKSELESKRAVLHVSNECFVPFGVTLAFPKKSIFAAKFNNDIRQMYQSGIIHKIVDEMRWEMQRSSKGNLLSVVSTSLRTTTVEEKGLTLEDTQGMFLLLGAGFLIAAVALTSEVMGGFTKRCRNLKRRLSSSDSLDDMIQPQSTPDEIFVSDSVSHVNSKSTSFESNVTLNGQIIHVSKEDIAVHENYDFYEDDFRSSNSVDTDNDMNMFTAEILWRNDDYVKKRTRASTASKGMFGEVVL
ncbi:unnamed protein product [Leptidea sinapis]|uniref:Ionotropic glutamate receptor L-glutamate and glycine-binding domain-containing protein n=1 Tax=Leptidea sinapis TaxID=189913 RepID=A0A5E4PT75_9NEOP|nr:unnamed protein product [Leptidea sinapis]